MKNANNCVECFIEIPDDKIICDECQENKSNNWEHFRSIKKESNDG